jgi:hypothetical protein
LGEIGGNGLKTCEEQSKIEVFSVILAVVIGLSFLFSTFLVHLEGRGEGCVLVGFGA